MQQKNNRILNKQRLMRVTEQYVYENCMTDTQKECYKSIAFDGLTPKEASVILNKSNKTIQTHYSRALEKVRQMQSATIVIFEML